MVWALTVTGQPARKRDLPADVAGLGALGQHAAPHHVVDFAGLDPCALDGGRQRQAPSVAPAALNAPL